MLTIRRAYRRHLPHYEREGRDYFVTFTTVGRFVLPPEARDLVLSHILFDHLRVMDLHVAVVMTDHAHLILRPYVALRQIMQGIKGSAARSINHALGREGRLWLHESFDHELRHDEDLRKKAEYVCMNPVRKGLCATPDEWPWLWRSWIEGERPTTRLSYVRMRFFIVDVFAEAKYQGNPLGVFVVERAVEAAEMQRIARELHFSECTFVTPGLRDGGFDVRIFTPDMEVPFAGHPTLGTAFVIRELLGWSDAPRITLNLGVGQVPVTFENGKLTMEQKQPSFGPLIEDRASIANILGVNELDERFPIEVVSTGLPSVIVPLMNIDAVRRCRINHELYARFLETTAKAAILVFAPHDDVRVRVFVDDEGFFEDPATGSANGNLAAWLLKHRYFGKSELAYRVEQGYEMGRPSRLDVEASESGGTYRIRVGGQVVSIAAGTWE